MSRRVSRGVFVQTGEICTRLRTSASNSWRLGMHAVMPLLKMVSVQARETEIWAEARAQEQRTAARPTTGDGTHTPHATEV